MVFSRGQVKAIAAGFALLLIAQLSLFAAGDQTAEKMSSPPENADPFAKATMEFEDVAGAFFYIRTFRHNAPAPDYAINSCRVGYMLSNPHGSNLLAGNFEALGEIFGGGFFDGPSGLLTGTSFLVRYNLLRSVARFSPYVQGGAGLVYTSVSGRESRDLVSLPVEFNLQAACGLRYRLDIHWSLLFEGSFRHISNAGLKNPNFGINSAGGDVGFALLF